jgi:hypothetical protein
LTGLLWLAACGEGSPAPAAQVQPDDAALQQAVRQGRAGAEVTFDATLLTDPATVKGHERFEARSGTGDVLEVDHNVQLAPAVPSRSGDRVVVRGQLYLDPGRAGVHCTHRETSRGCPTPGFIDFQGRTFD